LVLGGGPIGCELAQSFARLGTKVTLVEMAPQLLIREDSDAAKLVQDSLIADGVEIKLEHKAMRFESIVDANGKTMGKVYLNLMPYYLL